MHCSNSPGPGPTCRRAPLALAALAGLSILLLGRPLTAPAQDRSPDSSRPAVAALYAQRCQRCHDADGAGRSMRDSMSSIPDFTNGRWHGQRDDATLAVSILDGRGSRMPAFAGRLSGQEAEDLVAFVRAFGPAPAKDRGERLGDFAKRFDELERQLETLQRQFHSLAPRTASR